LLGWASRSLLIPTIEKYCTSIEFINSIDWGCRLYSFYIMSIQQWKFKFILVFLVVKY
jgi:hypothetical protein